MDLRRIPLRAILKRRGIEVLFFLLATSILLCKLTNYGFMVRILLYHSPLLLAGLTANAFSPDLDTSASMAVCLSNLATIHLQPRFLPSSHQRTQPIALPTPLILSKITAGEITALAKSPRSTFTLRFHLFAPPVSIFFEHSPMADVLDLISRTCLVVATCDGLRPRRSVRSSLDSRRLSSWAIV